MTTEITSPANPKLRYIRRLLAEKRLRQREKMFVVEGTRWMQEVAAGKAEPALWLATADWIEQNQALHDTLCEIGRPPLHISAELLQETAATETPSGVLAVLPQPELPWPAAPSFLLILNQVRDPGNAGTLLRSAAAAGVDGVIFTPKTVDPFNPKVVRSSMGAVLRLPLRETSWTQVTGLTCGCSIYVADGGATRVYTDPDWTQPAAVLVGGEAEGASSQARELAADLIAIPMHDETESLNAAVAGSIILFEVVRQRKMRE